MSAGLVTGAALVLVAGCHSLGYYAARSQLYRMAAEQHGMPMSSISGMFTSQLSASVLGVMLALPLCALLGPASGVAAGLACYAASAAVAAFATDSTTFAASMVLGGIGIGMYRPALWAALARPFGAGQESARTAVAIAVYATVNLVALPAPFVGNWAAEAFGGWLSVGVSAVASGVAALVALVPLGLQFSPGGAQPEAARARGLSLPVLAVAGGTVLVGGAGLVAWTVANDLQFGEAMSSAGREAGWFWFVNPSVVLGTGALAAVGLGVAALTGTRVPTLLVAGGGMVLLALGLVPLDLVGAGFGTVVAVVAVGAVGEALVMGPLFARACGDVHFRLSIAPAAALVLATTVPGIVSRLPRSSDNPAWGWVILGLGGVALLSGIVLLAGALPAQRLLATVEDPDDNPLDDPLGDPLGEPVGAPVDKGTGA